MPSALGLVYLGRNSHILPTGQWYAPSAVNYFAYSAYSAYPAYSAHSAYSAHPAYFAYFAYSAYSAYNEMERKTKLTYKHTDKTVKGTFSDKERKR